MSNYSERQEALETSRDDFERMMAQRYWEGIFEDCKLGPFEQNVSRIRRYLIQDGSGYALTGQKVEFRSVSDDWEIWIAAFEAGWEAR